MGGAGLQIASLWNPLVIPVKLKTKTKGNKSPVIGRRAFTPRTFIPAAFIPGDLVIISKILNKVFKIVTR